MGELFKGLSDDERKKYDDKNAEDKERYKKEMAAYEAKSKAAASDDDKSDSDSDSDSSDDDDDSDSDSD